MDALYDQELEFEKQLLFSSIAEAEKFRFRIYNYLKALENAKEPQLHEKADRLRRTYSFLLRDAETQFTLPKLEQTVLMRKLTKAERHERKGVVLIRPRAIGSEIDRMLDKFTAEIRQESAAYRQEQQRKAAANAKIPSIPPQYVDIFDPAGSLQRWLKDYVSGKYQTKDEAEKAWLDEQLKLQASQLNKPAG